MFEVLWFDIPSEVASLTLLSPHLHLSPLLVLFPLQEFGKHKEGEVEPSTETGPETGTGPGEDEEEPAVKKRRLNRKGGRPSTDGPAVEAEKIIDVNDLPSTTLIRIIPLLSLKTPGLELKMFVENKLYVVNTTDKPIKIPCYSLLCGFGKGRFGNNTDGKFDPEQHYMFKMKECEDMVLNAPKALTLKAAVHERKQTDPQAKIAYHSMFDVPSKDKQVFGLKQEHQIYFIPAYSSAEGDAKAEVVQNNAGAVLTHEVWNYFKCCKLIWATKWGVLGLTPFRPLVLFTVSCELDGGKALQL